MGGMSGGQRAFRAVPRSWGGLVTTLSVEERVAAGPSPAAYRGDLQRQIGERTLALRPLRAQPRRVARDILLERRTRLRARSELGLPMLPRASGDTAATVAPFGSPLCKSAASSFSNNRRAILAFPSGVRGASSMTTAAALRAPGSKRTSRALRSRSSGRAPRRARSAS